MQNSIDQNTDKAAKLLKTLAHPLRIRIMLLLTQQTSLNVSTLQSQLKVSQAILSTYLNMIEDRGLLISVRQGKESHYSLADPMFGQAISLLLERKESY